MSVFSRLFSREDGGTGQPKRDATVADRTHAQAGDDADAVTKVHERSATAAAKRLSGEANKSGAGKRTRSATAQSESETTPAALDTPVPESIPAPPISPLAK